MGKPLSKQGLIKKYLNSDLERFLKRIYRYSNEQRIYSKILNEYNEEVPGIKNQIIKRFRHEYPGTLARMINIHRVMVKYYDFVIDMEDIILTDRIESCLLNEIEMYRINKNRHALLELRIKPKVLNEKLALKELRARGFIHINDFDDYDSRATHISVKKGLKNKKAYKLYYPINFYKQGKGKSITGPNFGDIYLVQQHIGLREFTRISTPSNR